jgi:hypothetical protein
VVHLLHGLEHGSVLGEVTLGTSRHHTAGFVINHLEGHSTHGQVLANPVLFDEALLRRIDKKVRTETGAFESGLGLPTREFLERGGSEQMQWSTIEKALQTWLPDDRFSLTSW